MRPLLLSLRAPLLGVALALIVCALMLIGLGESPGLILEAAHATLFTSFGLGYTLFYSTPLVFTGLAVAICFHCGLFNIGAEGQLYLGSIAVVAVATLVPAPWPIALPLGILAAALGGGLWGAIAGLLKAYRGSHEVIVTILLNFIGIALANYAILYPLRNTSVQNPETVTVPGGYFIPTFDQAFGILESTPVNLSLALAVAIAFLCQLFLFRTVPGFELRAVGRSNRAAEFAGIAVGRSQVIALALGGALAGLVGINEVMGHAHRVVEGFSPQYGFTGIAVALLARNHPIGVLFSALLFGALHNSAREIEFLSERVSKEVSLVLQALIIGFVASHFLYERFLAGRRKREVA